MFTLVAYIILLFLRCAWK